MRVVVNTSPLIALERIGQLDLLKRMYGVVVRPQSVLDELNAGRGAYELSPLLEQSDWIRTEFEFAGLASGDGPVFTLDQLNQMPKEY